MANAETKPKLIYTAVGSLLARYIRFVGTSSRQTQEMTERFDAHSHRHPCIVAVWHGQFMLMPLVRRPGFEADVMLARHRDAELMGAVLRHFDMQLIRGAGAASRGKDRGGAHAYMAAVQTPARGPLGGDDGRRAGRRGAPLRPRHRHGRAPVRPADRADGHRHLALHRLQHAGAG